MSFLRVSDLFGQTLLTVTGVKEVRVGPERERKLALKFAAFPAKVMVLHRRNLGRMQGFFGENPRKWIGKKIVLRPTTTTYQGRRVPSFLIEHPEPIANILAAGFRATGELPRDW